MAESYFERDGDLIVPTELCGGPWDPSTLDGGAVGALLADAAARSGSEGFRLARLTVDSCGRCRCNRSSFRFARSAMGAA